MIAGSIAAWALAGLLTLGVVWPRRVRQKLFSADAPCEIEYQDGSIVENEEIVKLKMEVENLREQLERSNESPSDRTFSQSNK